MSAAIDYLVLLDAMADDTATAMRAGWRQFLNGAFEAVKSIGFPRHRNIEGFVIFITAQVAACHESSPRLNGPGNQSFGH
ncbi:MULTISPECIES: hypothetical protein [unclassified Sinorhizobium]|uniref:hypothetical protein n=1 Tax=unclassified Sinorhizobium TaxID=2613772 RepID=UPI003523A608